MSDETTTAPDVGDLALDTARDRVGVVMGHEGPYVQLRPPDGGREWDADPEKVRPADVTDELRFRLGEQNARRRWGL
nr:hypothetical protein [Actinacidiphila soli]